MPAITQEHSVAINSIMLATIAKYIAQYATDEKDLSNLEMYTEDVRHNIAALNIFNTTKNADVLYEMIMQQDTLVREYFIDVINYLNVCKYG